MSHRLWSKDAAIARAQRNADSSGNTHLVVNLNPMGAMWVVRDFHPELARVAGVLIISPR